MPKEFRDLNIKSLSCDSRNTQEGSLFVALKGTKEDGADFIAEALQKGARVVIKNSHGKHLRVSPRACILSVADPRKTLLDISNRFYDNPSRKVQTIGITGTNGKTTISYLIESVLKNAGKRPAVIGTVNYRLAGKVLPSRNTTPGLLDNQHYLAQMAKERISHSVMEVSSHALDQGRVDAIGFRAAVFTNLTGDHLDYHKNMENYFQAKVKLFTGLSNKAAAVINTDDVYGRRLISLSKGKLVTYGLKGKAIVSAENVRLDSAGTMFTVKIAHHTIPIQTKLIGLHNVYNILAAAAVCHALGINKNAIKAGIEKISVVPGRLEQVRTGQPFHVFVDYAHTEDALYNVLRSLKGVSRAKIILVFGCGGDRDKTKRPKMGCVAGELADFTVVTSDNPRSENPQAIIKEIISGFKGKNYKVITNRKKAIRGALSLAKPGDVVLIAGKGHEDYQIFKNKTIHFDDREVARKFLKCLT